jgi:hypothetical protein
VRDTKDDPCKIHLNVRHIQTEEPGTVFLKVLHIHREQTGRVLPHSAATSIEKSHVEFFSEWADE